MKSPILGLLASTCAFACLAAPAFAADVTIRVEAHDRTLVPATNVTLPGPAVDKTSSGGTTCPSDTAASALEVVTSGDWGGRNDGAQEQRVEQILGVSHRFEDGRYWAFYVNDKPADFGVCRTVPQQGDELVLAVTCAGATTDCVSGGPLDLQAPATARPGEAFGVTVEQTTSGFGPAPDFEPYTNITPSEGATVEGPGTAGTTGADGRTTLTLGQRGPATLTVTKPDFVREAVSVCVTDGADGFCGTTSPSGQTGLGGGAPSAVAPDRTSPKAFLAGAGVRTFSRRRAPRLLTGKVDDAGGVLMVKLRLTRTTPGGRCFAYSGKRERFVRREKCGAESGWWFSIGDRADWEYQLPKQLGPGRYVLDVNAIDKSYNRDDARRRGENRAVFTVR